MENTDFGEFWTLINLLLLEPLLEIETKLQAARLSATDL